MPPAPVPDPVAPVIGIAADLTFEVGGDGRRTRAHLSGGPGTLVLDVDDPGVLLRSLPAGGSWRRLPAAGVTDLLSGTTIRVRSGGSELGSVRFARGHRPALRPTGSGIGVVTRHLTGLRPVRIVAGLIALGLVVIRVLAVRHRGAQVDEA